MISEFGLRHMDFASQRQLTGWDRLIASGRATSPPIHRWTRPPT
ncbi:hypothetical protein [Janthinobacterium agaricidamnosum]|uniref:Uncharacterized protein n=1 Tax=Janthinobacterium agaricidamnosum NBRC 102515 = DSM 9628 TaxID=1349767 RepID=W0VB32_9BURK|nr:hypothetical protein [Janthinobacterium agaricidamnosum]CDG86004.1 hypothetical protein GJA_5408 [Janthinobacterium agaricidamnosum NBRC 102515 = DSM 9628]